MRVNRSKKQTAAAGVTKGVGPSGTVNLVAGPCAPEELDDSDDECSNTSSGCSRGARSVTSSEVKSQKDQKRPAELFRTDFITAMKVPEYDLLDLSKCLVITDPWRNEWNRGVQVPVRPDLMPKSCYRTSTTCKTANNEDSQKNKCKAVKRPRRVSSAKSTKNISSTDSTYDLDDTDIRWLKLSNLNRDRLGLQPVTELVMESAIEALEHMSFDGMSKKKATDAVLGIEYDEDTVCDVCRLPDTEEFNEMIFCDLCNVAVHQVCYGIVNVPSGTWFCRPCSLGIKPTCLLCPNTGGAMKSTKSGQRWAHVSCALWIPEVGFADAEVMEPITSIASIPEDRWLLRCSICHQRSGACIQCLAKNCRSAYHVTCAQQNGLTMKIQADTRGKEDVIMESYCAKHSEPLDKQLELRGEVAKKVTASMKTKRLEEIDGDFYNFVDLSQVSTDLNLSTGDVQDIYEYWKLKRKVNWSCPLVVSNAEQQDISKQAEGMLYRKIKMLIYLRQNLETARNLCYMVVRREKLKRQLHGFTAQIFNKRHLSEEHDHEENAAKAPTNSHRVPTRSTSQNHPIPAKMPRLHSQLPVAPDVQSSTNHFTSRLRSAAHLDDCQILTNFQGKTQNGVVHKRTLREQPFNNQEIYDRKAVGSDASSTASHKLRRSHT